jgi:ABC-2 type transport system permease protein
MIERLYTGGWVAWMALRTEQRGMRKRPMVIVVTVLQPLVFMILTAGTHPQSPSRTTSLITAVILTAMWSATVWTAGGVLRRERTYGTLARCVTSVYPAQLVLFGKSLGASLSSIVGVVASCAVVIPLLGLPLQVASPLLLLPAAVLVVLSGTALGMLLSCLFLLTRHGLAWSGALIYPVFILGGLLIPSNLLPSWLSWMSSLLSLHWINEFVVEASRRGSFAPVPLLAALALSGVYFTTAVYGLQRTIRNARLRGTLELG